MNRIMVDRLPTGCPPLDNVLTGGFRFGDVSLLYGEASTGKTTMAMNCVVNHLRSDPHVKAYYIDADQKISITRLTQIAGNESQMLERLLIWSPHSFSEQSKVVEGLLDFPNIDNSPIVVDSITGSYRLEASDPEKTFAANKELNRQLGFLSESAKTKNSAIIVVGQVHSIFGQDFPQVEPVAQRLLHYWCNTILKLETASTPSVRRAYLEKPAYPPRACRFMLGEMGLEEMNRR